MSALVKLAKETYESCDIGHPAAECQLMVLPSKRKLVTQRCELRPAQGGAEDTEERVLTLVFQCPLWKAMLSSTSRPADCEGWFMVRSMRLSPTNIVGQPCERVRLLRSPREAGFDPLEESRRHRVCVLTSRCTACEAPLRRRQLWYDDSHCEARESLKSRRQILSRHDVPRGRRHRRGCLGVAEFGVGTVVVTETMSATVKLVREPEEPASDPVGYGMVSHPKTSFRAPCRVAEGTEERLHTTRCGTREE